MDEQSSLAFVSQALPWGQQSECMPAIDIPLAPARAMVPDSGSIATASAISATNRRRNRLISAQGKPKHIFRG
jgi:hypothetical protein